MISKVMISRAGITVTLDGHGAFDGIGARRNRYKASFDADGFRFGAGWLDHITALCSGLSARTEQPRRVRDDCVVTDIDGDQFADDVVAGPQANGTTATRRPSRS